MRPLSSANGWQAPCASARPLAVWQAPQLETLATLLHARLRSWADAWGLELPRDGGPTCSRARECIDGPWRSLVQEAGASAWIGQPAEFAGWVARGIVGVEVPNTPVATALVCACLEDLRCRLAGAGGWVPPASGTESPCTPPVFARWSEGVLAMMPSGLRLLLDSAAARLLLKDCRAPLDGHGRSARPAALVSVASAVADFPMRLRVQLEACELDLGSLRQLQLGDVLRLRHRLEMPAVLRTAGGDALFSGFLVRSRGRKAVELAPAFRSVDTRGEP